jgi:hypothetical protein
MSTSQKVARVAQGCIERMDALNIKGKTADRAALDYFAGAYVTADACGDKELAAHLGRAIEWMVSIRGMFGVRELATAATLNARNGQ